MSDQAYAKAQAQQKTLIGSSPKSSLLQRTCACGQYTLAGGECSACHNEQSTLLRSQRAFGPPSALTTVQDKSPAQENVASLNSTFDRASRFGHDFTRIPIHSMQISLPQTKLKVNQPGDVYEQEADQVAEQVMRMTDLGPSVSDDEDETKTSLLRKQSTEPRADAATDVPSVPSVVHAVLNSSQGHLLDTTTRAFMESRFGHDFSRIPTYTSTAGVIHTKLAINKPGDEYEREADRVADQVLAAPAHPAVSGVTPHIQGFVGEPAGQTDTAPASVDRVLANAGRPLEPAIQQEMGQRLGHDFSQVRIHTDEQAAESARAVNALAYTVGGNVVFGQGRYVPGTREGKRLLAHELTHVVQQSSLDEIRIGQSNEKRGLSPVAVATDRHLPRLSLAPFSVQLDRNASVAAVSSAADQVRGALGEVDPISGVGNFPKAFSILDKLLTDELLKTVEELGTNVDILLGYSSGRSGRIRATLYAAKYRRTRSLPPGELKEAQSAHSVLSPQDQSLVKAFLLKTLDEHDVRLFMVGEEKEIERLAGLQAEFWEKQRKQDEENAKRAAEETAKKAGALAPKAAPKVTLEESINKQAEKRDFATNPTDRWTTLSEGDKKNWSDKRAPEAWNKVIASIKGTELENVMKGKAFIFEPEKSLKEGFYARQYPAAIGFGMAFVENVEADPKSVWPLLAHEMGGHSEYGTTYTTKIFNKAIEMLPEPTRTELRKPENMKRLYFAYQYSETEIYSALRQKRYDDPVSGPKPKHGAMLPEANIANHLDRIKTGFPPEVAKAILIELKKKVDASTEILDRDKQYFVQQIKAILGFDL